MKDRLRFLALLPLCWGCDNVSDNQRTDPLPPYVYAKSEDGLLTKNQLEECKRTGGQVKRRGILQKQACVHQFSDAGLSCQSGSDCQGKCLVVDESGGQFGKPAVGQCQAETGPVFGCFAEVENGKMGEMICRD